MATDTSWFPPGISTPEEVPWFSTAVDWQDVILEDAAHDIDLRSSIENLGEAFGIDQAKVIHIVLAKFGAKGEAKDIAQWLRIRNSLRAMLAEIFTLQLGPVFRAWASWQRAHKRYRDKRDTHAKAHEDMAALRAHIAQSSLDHQAHMAKLYADGNDSPQFDDDISDTQSEDIEDDESWDSQQPPGLQEQQQMRRRQRELEKPIFWSQHQQPPHTLPMSAKSEARSSNNASQRQQGHQGSVQAWETCNSANDFRGVPQSKKMPRTNPQLSEASCAAITPDQQQPPDQKPSIVQFCRSNGIADVQRLTMKGKKHTHKPICAESEEVTAASSFRVQLAALEAQPDGPDEPIQIMTHEDVRSWNQGCVERASNARKRPTPANDTVKAEGVVTKVFQRRADS